MFGRLCASEHRPKLLRAFFRHFVQNYGLHKPNVSRAKLVMEASASMLESLAMNNIRPLTYTALVKLRSDSNAVLVTPNLHTSNHTLPRNEALYYSLTTPAWLTHVQVARQSAHPGVIAVYAHVRERLASSDETNEQHQQSTLHFGAAVDTSNTVGLPSTINGDNQLVLTRADANEWRVHEYPPSASHNDINSCLPSYENAVKASMLAGLPGDGTAMPVSGAAATTSMKTRERDPRWFFEDDTRIWKAIDISTSRLIETVTFFLFIYFFFL